MYCVKAPLFLKVRKVITVVTSTIINSLPYNKMDKTQWYRSDHTIWSVAGRAAHLNQDRRNPRRHLSRIALAGVKLLLALCR